MFIYEYGHQIFVPWRWRGGIVLAWTCLIGLRVMLAICMKAHLVSAWNWPNDSCFVVLRCLRVCWTCAFHLPNWKNAEGKVRRSKEYLPCSGELFIYAVTVLPETVGSVCCLPSCRRGGCAILRNVRDKVNRAKGGCKLNEGDPLGLWRAGREMWGCTQPLCWQAMDWSTLRKSFEVYLVGTRGEEV